MKKEKRQGKILELIAKKDIGTQEELTAELRAAGFPVTQATVSRDLREMNLTKITSADGRLRYVAYQENDEELVKKYFRVLRDGFVSMDNAMNLLVVRTVSGMAMAVAASLDALDFPEIVGTIAGDDTVMCAVRSVDDTVCLMRRLRKILQDGE